jgi:lantibiotic modifying enzyme
MKNTVSAIQLLVAWNWYLLQGVKRQPQINLIIQNKDEVKIYYFVPYQFMTPTVDDIKAARYYEEVIRLMNEMVALLKENNTTIKQHNRTVNELNDTVRKININTGNLR